MCRPCPALRCCDIILLVIGGLNFLTFLVLATVYHSDSAYQRTVCNVESINDTEVMPCKYCDDTSVRTCTTDHYHRRTCTSKRRCYTSRFPCAKINVSYKPKGSSKKVQSYLHETAFQERGGYPLCALIICHKHEEENFMRVKQFTNIWSEGLNSTCYYHENKVEDVIAMKVFATTGRAAKAVAIPCILALLAFGCVAFRVYRWKKANDRNPQYQGGKVLTAPPPAAQQSYPMQPMPPQPTYPPPQMPPMQQPQAYPPPGMPPPQPYPGYQQQGPYAAPPPPAGAYPPQQAYPPPGGAYNAPQQVAPPSYNPEMQPVMMGGPVPVQQAGPLPPKA